MGLTNEIRCAGQKVAADCVKFMNASPSPYHAVETCRKQLVGAGFTQLKEDEKWAGAVAENGKYFVTRNQSSLIAFTVGGKYKATGGGGGFKIVGAHTDSPCFVLKPKSLEGSCGYKQVGVQCYGGGLWHTWFDRDVSIAGRVVHKGKDGALKTSLIKVDRPIMRIPNLAIHLTSAEERGKFSFNKEEHLLPMLCSEAMAELVNGKDSKDSKQHHPELLNLIASECDASVEDLMDFELYLYDTQSPAVGGLLEEFVFSARIDNLVSCFNGLEAMKAVAEAGVADDDMVSMVAFYDHEEVGSSSAVGAGSAFTLDVIRRVVACFSDHSDAYEQAIRSSFCMSVDGVHGVHPNYAGKHQMHHRPLMHSGPAIKYNANQRYATSSVSSAITKRCAELADIPIQEICVKNDSPCGSTIGPIISTNTGIATVDIGIPMLSMHSIREQCGTVDLHYMTEILISFFKNFKSVKSALATE